MLNKCERESAERILEAIRAGEKAHEHIAAYVFLRHNAMCFCVLFFSVNDEHIFSGFIVSLT